MSDIEPTNTEEIKKADGIESTHPPAAELLKMEGSMLGLAASPSEPVKADCHTNFKAYHKSGTRPTGQIWWIVMHDTEGGTAQGVALYFSGSNSGGSAHLVVDDNACYRCLDNNEIPWGAPGANYHGFHIEQCGFAKWSRTIWSKTHRKQLMRAAYKTAFHCAKFNIPVIFVTAPDLKKNKPGITTHLECTRAFGGSHVDPGPGWPKWLFMQLTKTYYRQLTKV